MNMHQQGGVTTGAGGRSAGVDVSKRRVANDAGGWGELIALLNAAEVDLVVVEATGGYERGAVCAVQEAQLAVAGVNPRQARDFAKSMGVQ